MHNLLSESSLPFKEVPFDKIESKDFLPALDKAIEDAQDKLKKYEQQTETSFKSIVVKLDQIEEQVQYINSIFDCLYSSHCHDDLAAIASEISTKTNNFYNDITLSEVIFKRVKKLYTEKEKHSLSDEQEVVLEKLYRSFIRDGALLNTDQKNRYREISQRLSELSLHFSENIRQSKNNYYFHLKDESDLEGLPESNIKQAKQDAIERKLEGYVITSDYPSYIPFLTYCRKRELRKKISEEANAESHTGKFSNLGNIKEILILRNEKALMLGYKNHASYVLEQRMAKDQETVFSFIDNIISKALVRGEDELEQLNAIFQKDYPGEEIQSYDRHFYCEKLLKKKLEFDSEELRPYFKIENVIDGAFQVATKLYDISFHEKTEIPVYHEDVKVYEVKRGSEHIGLFYCDFHPRKEKRGGAWMTNIRPQGYEFSELKRPHVQIVCNFTKPGADQPSLLAYDEVRTLFHEFGHALHGLLSDCQYKSVSGTNVFWDFVELPSQIMENWTLEKECLEMIARHFETNELIPDRLIGKIKEQEKFLQGLYTLRQLRFAYLDMMFHTVNPDEIIDIESFEKLHTEKHSLFPSHGPIMSTQFSHIFAGGYSAGYYSYKWAEVLDADAFEVFQEKGIFNVDVATKFRTYILEKGGSQHPAELYRNFKGSDPSVDALLKRSGL